MTNLQRTELHPRQGQAVALQTPQRNGVSVLGAISLATVVLYGLMAALSTVLWMTSGSLFLPYDVASASPDSWLAVLGVVVGLGAAPVCLAAAVLAIIALTATRRHVGLPIAALVTSAIGLVPAGLLTVWAGAFTYLWGWGR